MSKFSPDRAMPKDIQDRAMAKNIQDRAVLNNIGIRTVLKNMGHLAKRLPALTVEHKRLQRTSC